METTSADASEPSGVLKRTWVQIIESGNARLDQQVLCADELASDIIRHDFDGIAGQNPVPHGAVEGAVAREQHDQQLLSHIGEGNFHALT